MKKLAAIIDDSTIKTLNETGSLDASGTFGAVKPVIFSVLQNYILPTAFFLVIAYGIYGGILYITSYGNEEKATKGKNTMVWAIVGAIIIALAFVIVRYVSIGLLGADSTVIDEGLIK